MNCFFSKKSKIPKQKLSVKEVEQSFIDISPRQSYFFVKQNDKKEIIQRQQLDIGSIQTSFCQEKQIIDDEYIAMGFKTEDLYKMYIKHICQNGQYPSQLTASKFLKDIQSKKLSIIFQILRNAEEMIKEEDWVIEKQELNVNLTFEIKDSRSNLIIAKRELEKLVEQNVFRNYSESIESLIQNSEVQISFNNYLQKLREYFRFQAILDQQQRKTRK